MRADEHALAALDAQVRFPDGDLERDVALLPLGGAGGEGAVHRHGRDGNLFAFEGDDGGECLFDEVRRFGRNRCTHGRFAGGFGRDFDFVQVGQGLVHGFEVLLDDRLAAFAVGLLDGMLDLLDGLFARQDAGDGEEAGLHDGVDAAAHAGQFGHFVGVDVVEFELLVDDRLLDFDRQVVPDFVGAENAVEQEGAARLGIFEDIVAFEEAELVAGDKVGSVVGDQVRRLNRFGTKAQVG